MPPQQTVFSPGQAPVPQNNGQYDFIIQGNHRHSGGLFGANLPKQTLIIIVLSCCVVLLLVGVILSAVLANSGNGSNAALLGIAQRQAELARISQQPTSQADGQSTQNFAATVYTCLLSEQTTFTTLLASHGARPSAKQLAARQSAQTDRELADAKTAGTYDQTYLSVTNSELAAYVQALKLAYDSSAVAGDRSAIQDAYAQAQLLITMGSKI